MGKVLLLLVVLAPFIAISKDYYTIEVLKSKDKMEVEQKTAALKELNFDAFTQIRPLGLFLSCINKFESKDEAMVMANNLKLLGYFSSYEISLVLSKHEYLTRFATKKETEERLPAQEIKQTPKEAEKTEPQKEASIITRTPAMVEKVVSTFEGIPFSKLLENPVIKGQKFITTDKGLFMAIPTSKEDHWEKVNTPFDAANTPIYISSNGEIFVEKYLISSSQADFKPYIDIEKFHLASYKVNNITEKDALLWVTFTRLQGEREPASESNIKDKRIFLSADGGKEWSELPSIIKKDF